MNQYKNYNLYIKKILTPIFLILLKNFIYYHYIFKK